MIKHRQTRSTYLGHLVASPVPASIARSSILWPPAGADIGTGSGYEAVTRVGYDGSFSEESHFIANSGGNGMNNKS